MLSAERASSSLSQELNDNDDDTLYNRIPFELARLFFYYLYAFSIASSTVKQEKKEQSQFKTTPTPLTNLCLISISDKRTNDDFQPEKKF